MKRMKLQAIEKEFPAIEKEEQAMYIGKVKYTYKGSGDPMLGNSWIEENDGQFMATICVQGESGSTQITPSSFLKFKNREYFSENDAMGFFKFMADKTGVEWSISIRDSGIARVHTDNEKRYVQQFLLSDTTRVIHSHKGSDQGTVSDDDFLFVGKNASQFPNAKYTLYYNGQYINYDQYGTIGWWY